MKQVLLEQKRHLQIELEASYYMSHSHIVSHMKTTGKELHSNYANSQ